MWRTIPMAAALAFSCASGLSSVTSAHDLECQDHLRLAPIEKVIPPDGWMWNTLTWGRGSWTGSVTAVDEESWALAILSISCSDDAAADMARQREVRAALGTFPSIAVAPIGDEAHAFLDADRPQIAWRKGDAIASLNVDGQVDLEAFEGFAVAISALLP